MFIKLTRNLSEPSMFPTPLPGDAVALTLSGSGLSVYLPPSQPDGRGHRIEITADEGGMKILLNILRERAAGKRTVGTWGAPTQHQVDQDPSILAGYGEAIKRNNAAAKAAMRELAELGL